MADGGVMQTSTVNIAFQKDLLKEIDKAAKNEFRSRSEFIREAARLYLDRRKRWDDIFSLGDKQRTDLGLEEEDIEAEIKKHRAKKKTRH